MYVQILLLLLLPLSQFFTRFLLILCLILPSCPPRRTFHIISRHKSMCVNTYIHIYMSVVVMLIVIACKTQIKNNVIVIQCWMVVWTFANVINAQWMNAYKCVCCYERRVITATVAPKRCSNSSDIIKKGVVRGGLACERVNVNWSWLRMKY